MIIYLATNKINGYHYVGQTIRTLEKRVAQHKCVSAKPKSNTYFYRSIKAHGWDNFEFEILEHCIDEIDLDISERFWIKVYQCLAPNGYNSETGGHKNKTHTAEARQKISDAHKSRIYKKGYKRSPEIVQKIAAKIRGRPMPQAFVESRRGEGCPTVKLTWDKVREIRARFAAGESCRSMASEFGVTGSALVLIVRNKRWQFDPLLVTPTPA